MKTLASLVAATIAFAALAASAAAKEVKRATVCGVSDCVVVKDREKAMALISGDEGSGPGSPPPASSFYTVEVTIDTGQGDAPTWTLYYVPSAAMTRPAYDPHGDAGASNHPWWAVSPSTEALYRQVTKGLEPFPRPHLSSVAIGSKTLVAGADSYLQVYELPPTRASGSLPTAYSEWIDLRSKQPTPWTDLPRDLSFSPSGGVVERGGQVVKLPEALLADMQAGRPLGVERTDAARGGSSFPWMTLAATLAAALAGAVLIAFVLRRARFRFPRRRPSEA
jgi:hypothetical protein